MTKGSTSRSAPVVSKLELAYATIRERIAGGVYGPGYRLVLDELAREMGISPGPVREAVRRLEAEGYVEFQRNVGPRVATFDPAKFVQLLSAVALLEGYATALAAPRLSPDDIAAARRINGRMRTALADLDALQFSALNREFHFTIYERCPNRHICALLETEWARLDTIRRSAFLFVPGRSRSSVAEHEALLDLIESGASPDRIEQAARDHKLHTADAVATATGDGVRDTLPGRRTRSG